MPSRVQVFIILLSLCAQFSFIIGDADKACRINDTRNSIGICKPIKNCSAVIGLLKAGVQPTPCVSVALGYGDKPDWRCGGTLIDSLFVVTAGHCAITAFGPPRIILLGDRRLSTKRDHSRTLVNVSQVYVHPKYRPPLQYNDIAIIKLEAPVKLSRAILPACLPNPDDRLDRAIGVEASGWGRTGAFNKQSDSLKSVTLAKFDTQDCDSFFPADKSNADRLPNGLIRSQFCAGDKHGMRDTCQGDSGGPVTVENENYSCVRYLVGITSFGSSLCGYQTPGVYTNVLSFLDWIEDIVWRNLTVMERPESLQNDKLIFNLPTITTPSTTTIESTTSIKTIAPLMKMEEAKLNQTLKINNATSQTNYLPPPPVTTALNTNSEISLEKLPPPVQQMNQRYNLFNISSTIADLLNKFSFGR